MSVPLCIVERARRIPWRWRFGIHEISGSKTLLVDTSMNRVITISYRQRFTVWGLLSAPYKLVVGGTSEPNAKRRRVRGVDATQLLTSQKRSLLCGAPPAWALRNRANHSFLAKKTQFHILLPPHHRDVPVKSLLFRWPLSVRCFLADPRCYRCMWAR